MFICIIYILFIFLFLSWSWSLSFFIFLFFTSFYISLFVLADFASYQCFFEKVLYIYIYIILNALLKRLTFSRTMSCLYLYNHSVFDSNNNILIVMENIILLEYFVAIVRKLENFSLFLSEISTQNYKLNH